LRRQSRVGGILVSRFDAAASGGRTVSNTVAGVDWYVNFTPSVYVRGMISGSRTQGVPGGDGIAGSVDISHEGNRVTAWWVQEFVGRGYKASTGFLSRPDLIRGNPGFALDYRPAWKPAWIRRFRLSTSANIYHRASDRAFQEAAWSITPLRIDFQNSARVAISLTPTWQHLDQTFQPLGGLQVSSGDYRFTRWSLSAASDVSRRIGGQFELLDGRFYDGRLRTFKVSGRANFSEHLGGIASYEWNRLRDVGGPGRNQTIHLWAPEARWTFNPRIQLAAFYQYSSASRQSSWNARFSWEFRPLSYVYVVFNDRARRDTAFPSDRQLIVKLSFLGQM
jgi:hypothetical protein